MPEISLSEITKLLGNLEARVTNLETSVVKLETRIESLNKEFSASFKDYIDKIEKKREKKVNLILVIILIIVTFLGSGIFSPLAERMWDKALGRSGEKIHTNESMKK